MTYTQDGVRWRFREMSRAEINQDPVEREFFGDEPLNVRLAREVIQNSLDASLAKRQTGLRDVDEPVKVRFSLKGLVRPLPAHRAMKYFEGLWEHLNVIDDLDEGIKDRIASNSLTAQDVP